MRKKQRKTSIALIITLLCTLLPTYGNTVFADDDESVASSVQGDLIEIEAPPEDITIIVEGPKKPIHYIDTDVTGISNVIAIFTSDYGDRVQVPQFNVALQVDSTSKVTNMVNSASANSAPSWAAGELTIPSGGYVVMAQDDSYNTIGLKKYLATQFQIGSTVKLRRNGDLATISDLMSGSGPLPRLQLAGMNMYTTKDTVTSISGTVTNAASATLSIDGQAVALRSDGAFDYEKRLTAGPNYIDVVLSKDDNEIDRKSVIVYSRPTLANEKQIILWVDQAANAKKFQSSNSVLQFLQKAKDAGVTDVIFDVKGVEGYVSYKKNDISHRPYVSEMTAGDRTGAHPELDLLELFLEHGHALDLKVHVSFNVFAEGSIAVKDFAIIDDHLDWEEQVYRPEAEDNGEIKRLRESAYGLKGLSGASGGAAVLFVNPSNDEARQYQLDTFEEVLKNYDVDGLVLDRGRYDNETADFSNVTKDKFEQFLQKRGKQLHNWPADIFYYDNGKRVEGPLIQEWWEFRSGTIQSFVEKTRELVDRYTLLKGRKIETSAYVGAWFESYYLNGVHWGSKNFRYDERLKFPSDSIYTDEYYKTGYIDELDFLMVGTYYSSPSDIQRYITIDSIVTNGEVPLYAGMALADLQDPGLQREIFQTALGSSDGLMLFDASLANWPVVKSSIEDSQYVKDYQIGMSNPLDPASFIEGSYYNVSRNLGDLNVFSEEFGTSTGTNKFGVEVVADAAGQVIKVVNKKQASDWNWTTPEDNNSAIPTGGMVISALDENGVRTKRQLIANTYQTGDNIRAAALSGYLEYDGKTVSSKQFSGNVKVLGAGANIEVMINQTMMNMQPNGDFTGTVPLSGGSNTLTYIVKVDGLKTNEKSIQVQFIPTAPPSSGGGAIPQSPTIKLVEDGLIIGANAQLQQDKSGRAVLKATLSKTDLTEALNKWKSSAGHKPSFIVDIPATEGNALLSFPLTMLDTMASAIVSTTSDPEIVLAMGKSRYHLPLKLIQSASLAEQLGAAVDDVEVMMSLRKLSAKEMDEIAKATLSADGTLISNAYQISLTAQTGAQQIEITDFDNRYAGLAIATDQFATNYDRFTAVQYDSAFDSKVRFVPALLQQRNNENTVGLRPTRTGIFFVLSASKTFNDINGHWAQSQIELLASKLLVKGISEQAFKPDRSITRAEFAALLVRALGLTDTSGSNPFSDIKNDDWYAASVATAAHVGLIEGYQDGTFRPNQNISREQLAVMAVRAQRFINNKDIVTTNQNVLQSYTDHSSISSWAQHSVAEALQSNLMKGISDNIFAPKNQTTRAQAVVLLKKLIGQYKQQ